MSSQAAIARPYAKAIFEMAVDGDSGENWRESLTVLSKALEDEKLSKLINDPRVEKSILSDVLSQVLAKNGFNESQVNLVQLLTENKRLSMFNEVRDAFNKLLDEYQQKKHCKVLSAVVLNSEQQNNVRKSLSKRFGGEIDVLYEVDASVIGGLRIEMNDRVIDETLLRRIKQLESDILQ